MRWATHRLGFQKRIGFLGHHLLLCATPTKALCCPDPELGVASWNRLKQLVRELGLEDPARPQVIVLRTKADSCASASRVQSC